jgi:hypothetical protein
MRLAILTALIALSMIANAMAGWVYLAPGFSRYGYRDSRGVLHVFEPEHARYDPSTRDFQVFVGGRWLSVGREIYRLTEDFDGE